MFIDNAVTQTCMAKDNSTTGTDAFRTLETGKRLIATADTNTKDDCCNLNQSKSI